MRTRLTLPRLGLAALLLLGAASAAPAQIFLGYPALRSYGYPNIVNAFGYYSPLSIIGPGYATSAYLGPNGVYVPQGGANYYAPYGAYNPNGASTPYANPEQAFAQYGPGLAPAAPAGAEAPPTGETGSATISPDGRHVTITANGNLYGGAPIPRTSDTIDARIDNNNQLVITWNGEPRAVERVTFSLLDKDHHVIKQQTVTSLPVRARLGITSKTAYYQVLVEYVNGTTTSVVSPL